MAGLNEGIGTHLLADLFGVTGFTILAESHITFHSHPERGYLAVDVFTCGPLAQPQATLDVFVETLHPERTAFHSCVRGDLSTEG